MDQQPRCLLTPAQIALLQLYLSERTSNTQILARVSGRSLNTIETQFKHINKILGTGKRDEALLLAIHRGWITFPHSQEKPA